MARLAFTAQQMLQDAEGDFAEAIYRFRDAEAANAPEQYALKREMNDACAKVYGIRQWIYRGRLRTLSATKESRILIALNLLGYEPVFDQITNYQITPDGG